MKVLLVNDDGPPKGGIATIDCADSRRLFTIHTPLVSDTEIATPELADIAFHIAEKITATHYSPATGEISATQQSEDDWLLLDGTPSTCTNIGLHHVAGEDPFDLVISGPNFGRNSSTVFTLGSGTIGGAMEAALSGYKAIALSFAIFDKSWTKEDVKNACLVSSRLIDHLLKIWPSDVHVYNVNIPLIKEVLDTKIYFTRLLENRSGSLFRLMSLEENHAHQQLARTQSPATAELKLREEGSTNNVSRDSETDWQDDAEVLTLEQVRGIKRWTWSVDFKDMEAYVAEHGAKGGGMTDGWAISQKYGSVTALRAAFQVVDGGAGSPHGGEEIILEK